MKAKLDGVLVLARGQQQRVLIVTSDGPIWVWWKPDHNPGNQPKLCFSAPKSVKIVREELIDPGMEASHVPSR